MGKLNDFAAGRIRVLRQERGLSQRALGELIGVGHPAVSDLETGKTRVSYDIIEKLVQAFGVDPHYFMPGENTISSMPNIADLKELLGRAVTLADRLG